MPAILTDAHCAILRGASERPDALLTPPARLLGAARTRMAARFVALGLAERVAVPPDAPRWLTAEDGGALGLSLTAAGRDAAAAAQARGDEPAEAEADDGRSPAATALARPPRPGSKAALLVELLTREGGSSLAALGTALGWQPHTVRAALTRLRQGGAAVERLAAAEGGSSYRLAPAAGGDASDTATFRNGEGTA